MIKLTPGFTGNSEVGIEEEVHTDTVGCESQVHPKLKETIWKDFAA